MKYTLEAKFCNVKGAEKLVKEKLILDLARKLIENEIITFRKISESHIIADLEIKKSTNDTKPRDIISQAR
jgi:RNA polymerase-interacting CarD/CdnL/TRCF family regulator